MDKTELEFRRRESTEHVRSSFFAFDILLDTFIELSRRYPDDRTLCDSIQALRYLALEIFDRITVMKIWDSMTVDMVGDDDGKST